MKSNGILAYAEEFQIFAIESHSAIFHGVRSDTKIEVFFAARK